MDTRTKALIGEEAFEKLNNAHILVFGLGGVGGTCVEALARSGIRFFTLLDGDVFSESNLNRQILALREDIGKNKTDVAEKRIKAINPEAQVKKAQFFWRAAFSDESVFDGADAVIDAIDDVPAKLDIIRICTERKIPVISSMGTGNKTDITKLSVSDISKTSVCPLARKVRTELKKLGIGKLKTVFSTETPIVSALSENGKRVPASMIFVPSAAGLLLASEVVKELTKDVYTRSR